MGVCCSPCHCGARGPVAWATAFEGDPTDQMASSENPADAALWNDAALVHAVGVTQEPPARTTAEQVTAHFLEFRLPIYRYLRIERCDPCDAEELTQEAFLRLYCALASGQRIDNVRRWLFTVARNLLIDSARHRARVTPAVCRLSEHVADQAVDPSPSLEERLLEHRRRRQLAVALTSLTPLQRQVLSLRAEGLRLREIAGIMNVSVTAVVDVLKRAVTRLQRAMREF
jgi:RNA polymerase sigma-70 factor (ECF subfamily)